MYLIQILLPLKDNQGNAFVHDEYGRVRTEMTERFGGVTFYARAPATGLWKDGEGDLTRDEVVVAEVMAQHQDREWWRLYRQELEARFKQDMVVIRIIQCGLL
ncbi:MAG TPA: hypothetical protein VFS20_13370 [Longimicrobium sp.]|nr:hypothetical protein [Longimicrobium sp.]